MRHCPSSDSRMRLAAPWPSNEAKRSGDDAADVLMLRGVLCPLSLSLSWPHLLILICHQRKQPGITCRGKANHTQLPLKGTFRW